MKETLSVMVTAAMLLLLGAGSAGADDHTVEITGVDYAFDGVPETVPTGTELTFTNASEVEFHEMVMFRVDDDQDMSLEEIVEKAAQESDGPPPEWLTFKGVALAMPNEDGFTPEGPVVLDEPGRYLLLCFIPTGADPEAIAEAIESGATGPELEGGAPHVAVGMAAELTAEGEPVEPPLEAPASDEGEADLEELELVAPSDVDSGTGGLAGAGMPGFVIALMVLGGLLLSGGAWFAMTARRK